MFHGEIGFILSGELHGAPCIYLGSRDGSKDSPSHPDLSLALAARVHHGLVALRAHSRTCKQTVASSTSFTCQCWAAECAWPALAEAPPTHVTTFHTKVVETAGSFCIEK